MRLSSNTAILLLGLTVFLALGVALTMAAPICEVHRTRMHAEVKPLIYGLTWGMPVKPIAQFPNSHSKEWAYSCLAGRKGTYRFVWVCPVCRACEQEWEHLHPDSFYW